VEQVVEVDPAFVERYLNDGDVDPRELHAPLEEALRQGHLIPICFVSARNGAGVAELLDVFERLMPNPAEGNPPQFMVYEGTPGGAPGGEGAPAKEVHAQPDPALHVIAHVFKVTVDPYVGKMGVFRIHQGTVTRDSLLYIGDGRKPFKVSHLYMLQGKEHVEVVRGVPGRHLRRRQGRRDALRCGAARRRRRRPPALEAAAVPGAGAWLGDRAEAPR